MIDDKELDSIVDICKAGNDLLDAIGKVVMIQKKDACLTTLKETIALTNMYHEWLTSHKDALHACMEKACIKEC